MLRVPGKSPFFLCKPVRTLAILKKQGYLARLPSNRTQYPSLAKQATEETRHSMEPASPHSDSAPKTNANLTAEQSAGIVAVKAAAPDATALQATAAAEQVADER